MYLLENGASLNTPNRFGHTPLAYGKESQLKKLNFNKLGVTTAKFLVKMSNK